MELIKRPVKFEYPGIDVPISTIPEYPTECPCCGAALVMFSFIGSKYSTIVKCESLLDLSIHSTYYD